MASRSSSNGVTTTVVLQPVAEKLTRNNHSTWRAQVPPYLRFQGDLGEDRGTKIHGGGVEDPGRPACHPDKGSRGEYAYGPGYHQEG
jgi:hypothetical protein